MMVNPLKNILRKTFVVFAVSIACFLISNVWAAKGAFRDENSVSHKEQLVKDLRSSDEVKRKFAKQELRTYRFRDIIDLMARYADDPNAAIRILMVQTIGELGGVDAAFNLKRLYDKEHEPRVRRAILVQLIALIGNEKDGVEFLEEVSIGDDDADNRFMAMMQLSTLTADPTFTKTLIKTFSKCWKRDKSGRNKIFSAVVLKDLGENNRLWMDAIDQGIQHSSVELRRRATLLSGSLFRGQTKDLSQDQRIINLLNDKDSEVRSNLASALASSEQTSAIPLLEKLAQDDDATVRRSAYSAMERVLVPITLKTWTDGLKDSDLNVRTVIIEILERRGDKNAIEPLQKLLPTETDLKTKTLLQKAISTLTLAR